ncbi:uncharacterized protein LOC135115013 [Scylla paramamosain]|uniref:uncharacterized protein LOC135115013 n=1 Tax=Scylla paramamosain TaxID=85552 RepID=UPI0030831963
MSRDFGPETGTITIGTTFPTYEVEVNGTTVTVALSTITLGLVFYLPNLFGESPGNARALPFSASPRSIQQDQRELLGQIEESMVAAGMDGHACVLRFICEMQANRFSHSSIFGEVLSLIFTPKAGGDASVLKDYIEAEMAGQSLQEATQREPSAGQTLQVPTCAQRYPSCPVSVFAALRRLQPRTDSGHSTREDRPQSFASNAGGG